MDGGSIPAPAGEPLGDAVPSLQVAVYPRACGGTEGALSANADAGGLSPRLRGNHLLAYLCRCWFGSIPAPAGEPLVFAGSPDVLRVYPRACGGTMNMSSVGMSIAGLSPRLRGNHRSIPTTPQYRRSIPAPAGEPRPASNISGLGGVYPRACGGTIVGSWLGCN